MKDERSNVLIGPDMYRLWLIGGCQRPACRPPEQPRNCLTFPPIWQRTNVHHMAGKQQAAHPQGAGALTLLMEAAA